MPCPAVPPSFSPEYWKVKKKKWLLSIFKFHLWYKENRANNVINRLQILRSKKWNRMSPAFSNSISQRSRETIIRKGGWVNSNSKFSSSQIFIALSARIWMTTCFTVDDGRTQSEDIDSCCMCKQRKTVQRFAQLLMIVCNPEKVMNFVSELLL